MRALAVTLLALVAASTPDAVGQWVGAQAPCDIGPGHFRVNSAIVNLKIAAERPNQRERMLAQTFDVLTRTITQDQQEQNPAAWYYLGRYFVERADAIGADSAFDRTERLAPPCAEDIARYRRQVWAEAYNGGIRNWQAGQPDSAAARLRAAALVVPTDPRAWLTLGRVWIAGEAGDSALQAFRRAAEVAAADTAFAREWRDALTEIGRIHLGRAQRDPIFQQWQRTRYSRDSLERMIANDSIILGRIVASAASRRARGTRLAPADQQVFTRDSTARAQSFSRGREARVALARKAAADSAALAAAFAPATEAYEALLAADPTAVGAATTLAGLHAQGGRPAQAAAVFDRLFERASGLAADDLFDAGRRLAGGNVFEAAARAYTLGLEQNPYHRDALLELANVYVQLRDAQHALRSARRLVEIDPLNRTAVRLLAAAWELQERPDSALKYLRLADSTLVVDVAMTSFRVEEGQAIVTGAANNVGGAVSRSFRLMVEFLDATGGVKGSQTLEIPALAAGTSHPFELRTSAPGAVGWRYRAS